MLLSQLDGDCVSPKLVLDYDSTIPREHDQNFRRQSTASHSESILLISVHADTIQARFANPMMAINREDNRTKLREVLADAEHLGAGAIELVLENAKFQGFPVGVAFLETERTE